MRCVAGTIEDYILFRENRVDEIGVAYVVDLYAYAVTMFAKVFDRAATVIAQSGFGKHPQCRNWIAGSPRRAYRSIRMTLSAPCAREEGESR